MVGHQEYQDVYDSLAESESVVASIAGELADRLDFIKLQPERIFNFSWDSAYLSQLLASKFPNARVVNQEYMETDFQFVVESNSVDLMVSNLAGSIYAPTEFFSECKKVLHPAGLLIFAVLATDSSTEANEPELGSNYPEIQQRELTEMPDLGDILLELGLTNPVVDLDLNTYSCIGFEKISHHLHYSAWNPQVSKIPAEDASLESSIRTKIEQNSLLRVIYGIAWNDTESIRHVNVPFQGQA